ncbi:hypothetical protein HanIR_Chr03g0108361 [Helianthus annuus]|nr:hypothetical protein HanIR_Chr03g0108361 [Helianthus annuus]
MALWWVSHVKARPHSLKMGLVYGSLKALLWCLNYGTNWLKARNKSSELGIGNSPKAEGPHLCAQVSSPGCKMRFAYWAGDMADGAFVWTPGL